MTKTALVEKNAKFVQYLRTEYALMQKLTNVPGVIHCFGLRSIYNQFTKKTEEHLLLQKASYGSLHQLSMFTKPFEESTAYVVMRSVAMALSRVH